MKQKMPISLRLAFPPAIAALSVMFLAGLSLVDLMRSRNHVEEEKDGEGLLRTTAPAETRGFVPIKENVPELSEVEALERLRDRPSRAAVERLWGIEAHREELFELLLSKRTPEEVRFFLLWAFDESLPAKALVAARAIAAERDIPESPLIFAALEVLSRRGHKDDLALFAERSGE